MEASLFARGLVLGLAIAAPVGPIGVLCIRRTLADGRLFGFVSGLGAATADAVYAAVAAFGLTAVSDALVQRQDLLRLAGGLFLCYLGVRTMLGRPAGRPPGGRPAAASAAGLLGAYASALGLTLTNPATILAFGAIFTGMGLLEAGTGYAGAALLVAGVFSGAALWWLVLSGGVSLLRARFTPDGLRWVNRLSGVVIAGFGLLALLAVGR